MDIATSVVGNSASATMDNGEGEAPGRWNTPTHSAMEAAIASAICMPPTSRAIGKKARSVLGAPALETDSQKRHSRKTKKSRYGAEIVGDGVRLALFPERLLAVL